MRNAIVCMGVVLGLVGCSDPGVDDVNVDLPAPTDGKDDSAFQRSFHFKFSGVKTLDGNLDLKGSLNAVDDGHTVTVTQPLYLIGNPREFNVTIDKRSTNPWEWATSLDTWVGYILMYRPAGSRAQFTKVSSPYTNQNLVQIWPTSFTFPVSPTAHGSTPYFSSTMVGQDNSMLDVTGLVPFQIVGHDVPVIEETHGGQIPMGATPGELEFAVIPVPVEDPGKLNGTFDYTLGGFAR